MFRRIRFRVGTAVWILTVGAVLFAWRADHDRLVRAKNEVAIVCAKLDTVQRQTLAQCRRLQIIASQRTLALGAVRDEERALAQLLGDAEAK
jgi:hypothetical protein